MNKQANENYQTQNNDGTDFNTFTVFDLTIVENAYAYVDGKSKNILSKPTIIEIGAAKVVDGKIIDTFTSLANPFDRDFSFIEEFDDLPEYRGITPSMLIGAPSLETVLENFAHFAGGSPLILKRYVLGDRFEKFKTCADSYGFNFDNEVVDICDIISANEVIVLIDGIDNPNAHIIQIASQMSSGKSMKEVFEEYCIPFRRDDCLGFATAFAELIIGFLHDLDLPF